jgi:hypothetical protein
MSSSGTQCWRTVPPVNLLSAMTLVVGGLMKRKYGEENSGGKESRRRAARLRWMSMASLVRFCALA